MVKVGVLGATGMVGQRFIQLLADHPDFEIAALAASGRSAGKKYEDATTWYMNSEMPESVRDITVIETDPAQMDKDVEIVFSSLPADFAVAENLRPAVSDVRGDIHTRAISDGLD